MGTLARPMRAGRGAAGFLLLALCVCVLHGAEDDTTAGMGVAKGGGSFQCPAFMVVQRRCEFTTSACKKATVLPEGGRILTKFAEFEASSRASPNDPACGGYTIYNPKVKKKATKAMLGEGGKKKAKNKSSGNAK